MTKDALSARTVDPERAAETTTGASVARSGMWSLLGNLLPQAYLIAVSIAAARFLGPDAFGRQSFIAFVELALASLLGTGLGTALSRYSGTSLGAGRGGEVRTLAQVASRLAWVAAGLAAVALAIVGLAGSQPRAAWVLAGVVAAAAVLQRVRSAVLIGFQRWREMTIAGLVVGLGGTVAVIAVLALGSGITGMFAVEAGAGIVLLVWTAALARQSLESLRDRAALAPARRMLRYAGISTVGTVLTLVIWRRSEFLFLNHYSTEAQIGFYSIAFAAAAAVLLLPLSFSGVLLPSLATLHGAGADARIRTGFGRAGRLMLLLSLPLTAGAIALGPRLVELAYGSSYGDAGTLLVILLVPIPVIVVGNLANVLLAAKGRLAFPTIVGVVAAVANVALDFALIPRYDAVGAAFANDAAQLAVSLPAILYVQRLLGPDWKARSLAKAFLTAAAGAFVAWGCVSAVGGAAGFFLGLASGVAVFIALARTLRVLSEDDAEWLDGAVGQALAGGVGRAVRFCAGSTRPHTA